MYVLEDEKCTSHNLFSRKREMESQKWIICRRRNEQASRVHYLLIAEKNWQPTIYAEQEVESP